MGWTLSTLQEAASKFLDGFTDTFFGTVFPICVRQAEERILHVTKLQPIRKRTTASSTGEVVGSFNDLMAPISLRPVGGVPLLYKELNWIREAFEDNAVTGTPAYYSIQQELGVMAVPDTQIIVAPLPSGPTSFTVEYMAKPTSLVDAGGQETWISRNCENALFYGVLFHAYNYEKGEADVTANYKEEFEKALSLLKGFTVSGMRTDSFRASRQSQPEG